MDSRGLHCLSCMAGGDKIICHNSLRDFVHAFALAAGLHAEKEETGLLPDDPRRRPGDLFFPSWVHGVPVAMDFAVTSPVQQSAVDDAAARQLAAATGYEERKLNDRNTADRCRQLGIRLVPAVAESFGAWGVSAQTV